MSTDFNINFGLFANNVGLTGGKADAGANNANVSIISFTDGQGNQFALLDMQINNGRDGKDPFNPFGDGFKGLNDINKALEKYQKLMDDKDNDKDYDNDDDDKEDKADKSTKDLLKGLGQLFGLMMLFQFLGGLLSGGNAFGALNGDDSLPF